MTLQPNTRVWRYMSCAKLVWMLQKKQLWLSSIEALDDKWEGTIDVPQLNAIINKRPPSFSAEAVVNRVAESVRALRKNAFVSCWTASEHESHAFWRIYCHSPEGVAIQTTLERLARSAGLPVMQVTYGPHEADGATPDAARLVAQKRAMFAYEQEVRVVLVRDLADVKHPNRRTIGVGLDWDPELHIENVWVHPEAPYWFMESVTETVRLLAPKLAREGTPLVWWSEMNSSPPF